jgi:hypothetical protein
MPSDNSPQLSSETVTLLATLRTEFMDGLPGVRTDPQVRLIRLFDVWRQATLRRIVDLAAGADAFFREGRLVPGNTLTRSVVETVAVHFTVWKKLETSIEDSDWSAVHALLLSASFGRRDKTDWAQKSIQILTAIGHLDKAFPGFQGEYELLCEFAHPGLAGTYGAYARSEGDDMQYKFGINSSGMKMGPWGQSELVHSLMVVAEIDQFLKALRSCFVNGEKHEQRHQRLP